MVREVTAFRSRLRSDDTEAGCASRNRSRCLIFDPTLSTDRIHRQDSGWLGIRLKPNDRPAARVCGNPMLLASSMSSEVARWRHGRGSERTARKLAGLATPYCSGNHGVGTSVSASQHVVTVRAERMADDRTVAWDVNLDVQR
jgi:hypothetical protein